jgi:hypothetical protein
MDTAHVTLLAGWLLRAVVALVGIALVVAPFLLYEDEERRLKGRLEGLWIRIDDAARESGSRHLAFIREVGATLDRVLSRLFGARLFTPRAVVVSAFLTVCSYSVNEVRSIIQTLLGIPNVSQWAFAAYSTGALIKLSVLGWAAWRLWRRPPPSNAASIPQSPQQSSLGSSCCSSCRRSTMRFRLPLRCRCEP